MGKVTSTVRQAELDDLDGIRECIRQRYEPMTERIGRTPAPILLDHEDLIRREMVWVTADDEGTIDGVLIMWSAGSQLQIDSFSTLPRSGGNRVGATLLEFAERWAVDRGLTSIQVYVNEAIPESVDYCRSLGFVVTGHRVEMGYRRVYLSRPVVR